jgi:AcrR family transcriptional regulator
MEHHLKGVCSLRHEINSLNTKYALAEALKEIVNKGKSYDKITISDIVKNCGINRNTFYYHFADIKELILWTLCNDMYLHIRNFDCFNGKQIREYAVNYLHNNRKFLDFAYHYVGFNVFSDNYVSELYPIILKHIEELEKHHNWQINPTYKKFVAEFYAQQVGSIYLMQFHKPDRYHKDAALKCLEMIFDYSIPDMLAHEKDIEMLPENQIKG